MTKTIVHGFLFIRGEYCSVLNGRNERHGIEFVAMNNEHPTSVRETMDGMLLHGDVAVGAVKLGEQIIVITRDVNDAGPFTRFPENLLNDVVMLLRPVNPAPQLPDVDQVATT